MSAGLIVQKFGGTSMGSPARILSVADRIADARARGHGLVVVVSAMGHSTDELIELAHQVSKDPPHREMDMLLSAGERISMALLSMALADRGVPALSFTGSQSGIITDESHRRARIKRILGDRIRAALSQNKVAIVAGFQGVSETKEITTLGRGGSDTTAVALAAALKAELCEIYTDVDGVFTADPRKVPTARFLKKIPHSLMAEMAIRGAGVLHPRSVELAAQYGVRLCVRNSLSPLGAEGNDGNHKGTEVIAVNNTGMEEYSVTGVAAARDQFLVEIELARDTVIGAVWDRATESHLPIIAPIFYQGKASFFSDRDGETQWKKLLGDLCVDGFVRNFKLSTDFVPLSVVGSRFSQDGRALSQVIEVLAKSHISVTMGSASSFAITVAVYAKDAEDGVRALHEAYLPDGHLEDT